MVALGGFAPPFCFLLSAFCFGMLMALGGFALCFFIHHSTFYILPGVASG
jgi:hypothetical protein